MIDRDVVAATIERDLPEIPSFRKSKNRRVPMSPCLGNFTLVDASEM
jgi:hypothetical protein